MNYARKKNGYTQDSLASAIGVSRGVIFNLEKRRNAARSERTIGKAGGGGRLPVIPAERWEQRGSGVGGNYLPHMRYNLGSYFRLTMSEYIKMPKFFFSFASLLILTLSTNAAWRRILNFPEQQRNSHRWNQGILTGQKYRKKHSLHWKQSTML